MSDTNPASTPKTTAATDKDASPTDGGGFAAVDAAAGGSQAASDTDGQDEATQKETSDAGDIGGRLRASLNKIADRADEIRTWSAGRQDAARDLVEARPLTVVGAALGIGLLLGLVASRV